MGGGLGYQPGAGANADKLIVGIYDTNYDNAISVGDTIQFGSYPKSTIADQSTGLIDFGSFSVTEAKITEVLVDSFEENWYYYQTRYYGNEFIKLHEQVLGVTFAIGNEEHEYKLQLTDRLGQVNNSLFDYQQLHIQETGLGSYDEIIFINDARAYQSPNYPGISLGSGPINFLAEQESI
jgi:hypothetical protein